MLVQLRRPALGALPDARSMGAEEQRTLPRLAQARGDDAALGAGQARGVVLRDVVAYYRVWNGFSATVSTRDLARLNSPGVRVRTVRRAYPASERAGPGRRGSPNSSTAGLSGQPPVAVLDTGRRQRRARRATPTPGMTPSTATAIPRRAAIPAAAAGARPPAPRWRASSPRTGERVLPIRIASLRAVGGTVEASTTTDRLLAGLEHAVDPNGDDDTSDHVPVALVGVNAPYAGFSNSPEAQAVEGAAGLGTLRRRAGRQRGRGRRPAAARSARPRPPARRSRSAL